MTLVNEVLGYRRFGGCSDVDTDAYFKLKTTVTWEQKLDYRIHKAKLNMYKEIKHYVWNYWIYRAT